MLFVFRLLVEILNFLYYYVLQNYCLHFIQCSSAGQAQMSEVRLYGNLFMHMSKNQWIAMLGSQSEALKFSWSFFSKPESCKTSKHNIKSFTIKMLVNF